MKLLVEFTPDGGTMQRISNEDIPLTYQWFSYIFSFSSFRLELDKKYGGYASPSYSDVEISPDAFEGIWPPSGDALFKIMLTVGSEVEASTIFTGYGTPVKIDREGAVYEMTVPEYSDTVESDTLQSGTLLSLMTSYCSTLGLTIDSSSARSVSPSVDYTPVSDVQLIDLMSDMCAFFTHAFKIVDGILYLYDMILTGTEEVITEFNMQPSEYGKANPVRLVKSGDYSVSGSSDYGDEFTVSTAYHTAQAQIEAALVNIRTVIENDFAEIYTMIDQIDVTVLDDITLIDTSTIADTAVSAKVTSTLYNFDSYTMLIEANGSVA